MRHILHILISSAMWALFAYYWYVVSGRQVGDTTLRALGILSILILGGLVATFWWVSHNMRLARRNRRRSAPPAKPETRDRDDLGRIIVAPDREALRRARVIEVTLAGDAPRKAYRIVDEEAG